MEREKTELIQKIFDKYDVIIYLLRSPQYAEVINAIPYRMKELASLKSQLAEMGEDFTLDMNGDWVTNGKAEAGKKEEVCKDCEHINVNRYCSPCYECLLYANINPAKG